MHLTNRGRNCKIAWTMPIEVIGQEFRPWGSPEQPQPDGTLVLRLNFPENLDHYLIEYRPDQWILHLDRDQAGVLCDSLIPHVQLEMPSDNEARLERIRLVEGTIANKMGFVSVHFSYPEVGVIEERDRRDRDPYSKDHLQIRFVNQEALNNTFLALLPETEFVRFSEEQRFHITDRGKLEYCVGKLSRFFSVLRLDSEKDARSVLEGVESRQDQEESFQVNPWGMRALEQLLGQNLLSKAMAMPASI